MVEHLKVKNFSAYLFVSDQRHVWVQESLGFELCGLLEDVGVEEEPLEVADDDRAARDRALPSPGGDLDHEIHDH